jgi:hypothetical protein
MATPTTPILANRYHLDSIVYSDSSVVAYQARDQILNRAVTVELLRPDKAKDQSNVQRMLDKARNAALVNLPHVAALYDQNVVDQRPFLVLEELAGPALADLVPLPANQAIGVVEKIAETLEAGLASQQPLPTVSDQTIRVHPEGRVQVINLGLEQTPSSPGYAVKTLGRLLSTTIAGADVQRVTPLRTLAERATNGEYQTISDFLMELRSLRQRADTPTTFIPRVHATIPIPDSAKSAPQPAQAPAVVAAPRAMPLTPPLPATAPATTSQPRQNLLPIAAAVGLILVVLAGFIALRGNDDQAAQTPSPSAVADNPAASSAPGASPVPTITGEVFVVNTRGRQALTVRSGPGIKFPRVASLPYGTRVEVIGGPQAADNFNWVWIRTPNFDGWCIREALRKP